MNSQSSKKGKLAAVYSAHSCHKPQLYIPTNKLLNLSLVLTDPSSFQRPWANLICRYYDHNRNTTKHTGRRKVPVTCTNILTHAQNSCSFTTVTLNPTLTSTQDRIPDSSSWCIKRYTIHRYIRYH